MIDFEPQVAAQRGRGRRPKTSELEVLVAIARAGTFGGAAVELGCTQSRISHALAEIESALGLRLFERSRTGTRPTEVGHRVVAKAREALELLDSISASRDRGVLRGTVRVAAYRSVATHLLTPLVDVLVHANPALHLELEDACTGREEVERMVRDGRADIGVVNLPAAAGFTVTPFAEDDYVVVVSSRHRPRAASLWADLGKLSLLELRCSGARGAVEACRQSGMTNRTTASFSSDSTILAQIATKAGFSILPRLAIEPLPKGLDVVALPNPTPRTLAIIRRSDRRSSLLRAVTVSLRKGIQRPTFPASRWIRVV
ncbi:LysR family transcriptional regulator [Pendulispora rubella]|uniref:LysR family transcriptional regulator n=1 Tax=Pendulispora rubella TaxID=2741070 RepID=A0ABZ2KY51_9BACT